MKKPRHARLLLAAALLLIAAALTGYIALARRWLAQGPSAPQNETRPQPPDPRELLEARRSFREDYLDPAAHLRLSEALRRAGRLEDSFYVALAAREFFGPALFGRAHDALIRGRPAAEAAPPPGAEPLALVTHYARLAHAAPQAYEGRAAIEALGRMARIPEEGPAGEASRLAREGLEELLKARPSHPGIFTALALALKERGDQAGVRALIAEALKGDGSHAGAAFVEGLLALEARQTEKALRRFSDAREQNPDDLRSAAGLAQIHLKERGDREAALPLYLALYRDDPGFNDGEAAERRIRRILDERRETRLARADADALGGPLRSEDGSLRAQACARAAELGDPRWIEVLGALLDDDAAIVRRNAAYALYRLWQVHPDAVAARREEWLSAESPLQRAAALELFADLEPRRVLPLALAALRDPRPSLRYLTKSWVLDRYYAADPDAAKAVAAYAESEKDPFAVELLNAKSGP